MNGPLPKNGKRSVLNYAARAPGAPTLCLLYNYRIRVRRQQACSICSSYSHEPAFRVIYLSSGNDYAAAYADDLCLYCYIVRVFRYGADKVYVYIYSSYRVAVNGRP